MMTFGCVFFFHFFILWDIQIVTNPYKKYISCPSFPYFSPTCERLLRDTPYISKQDNTDTVSDSVRDRYMAKFVTVQEILKLHGIH